jgi:intracellular sulfur oxidation DsrE/DsrF family protein
MYGTTAPSPRRKFIGQFAAAAASIAAISAFSPLSARAGAIRSDDSIADGDAWMKPLKGKHRQIFHAVKAESTPMLMAKNYLDAYQESFHAREGEVNAVIGFHGAALVFGFQDAIWDKYGMGKSSEVNDPSTKAPATRNVFATGGDLAIDTLQKRGVVFLMCNTALRLRTRAMSQSLGVPYDTLYAELAGSRIPGVILVPALVVALNRAQERGFTYVRAS